MARSSMARTLLDQGGSVVAGPAFRNGERHDDAPARIRGQHVDDLVTFVADFRVGVRQNISHIPALVPIRVIAELVPDEEGPEAVLEREPVGELPLYERTGRQRPSQIDRRLVVLVRAALSPPGELVEVPAYERRQQGVGAA